MWGGRYGRDLVAKPSRARLSDRRAVPPQHVPVAAELKGGLAAHLARRAIADVVVDGVPRVGGLELSVAALGGPDQAGLRSRDRRRCPLDDVRRPGGGAIAGAVAALPLVRGEQVE